MVKSRSRVERIDNDLAESIEKFANDNKMSKIEASKEIAKAMRLKKGDIVSREIVF